MIASKLVEQAARMATGLKLDKRIQGYGGVLKHDELQEALVRVSARLISEKKGLLRCGLCGKGPFTKRGLYLHLMRVHADEIQELLEEEIARTIRLRNRGP